MNEQVEAELKNLLNNRYSTSESTRGNYARGEDTYDPILSKAVVFPETNEEVSKILRICNEVGKMDAVIKASGDIFEKAPI